MAIIESNGAILLLPGHYYLDNDHDHDDNRRRGECFQFLIDEIDIDDITSTPTCAIWYSRLTGNGNDGNGNSEMLIISVKVGYFGQLMKFGQ